MEREVEVSLEDRPYDHSTDTQIKVLKILADTNTIHKLADAIRQVARRAESNPGPAWTKTLMLSEDLAVILDVYVPLEVE